VLRSTPNWTNDVMSKLLLHASVSVYDLNLRTLRTWSPSYTQVVSLLYVRMSSTRKRRVHEWITQAAAAAVQLEFLCYQLHMLMSQLMVWSLEPACPKRDSPAAEPHLVGFQCRRQDRRLGTGDMPLALMTLLTCYAMDFWTST
jgi:hypothetical protein